MKRIPIPLSYVSVLLCSVQLCLSQDPDQPEFNPRVVLQNAIRPIADAPFVAADDATEEFVTENELVLGVVVNGKSRAYPINMITGPQREIVNDRLGGRAIAATW